MTAQDGPDQKQGSECVRTQPLSDVEMQRAPQPLRDEVICPTCAPTDLPCQPLQRSPLPPRQNLLPVSEGAAQQHQLQVSRPAQIVSEVGAQQVADSREQLMLEHERVSVELLESLKRSMEEKNKVWDSNIRLQQENDEMELDMRRCIAEKESFQMLSNDLEKICVLMGRTLDTERQAWAAEKAALENMMLRERQEWLAEKETLENMVLEERESATQYSEIAEELTAVLYNRGWIGGRLG